MGTGMHQLDTLCWHCDEDATVACRATGRSPQAPLYMAVVKLQAVQAVAEAQAAQPELQAVHTPPPSFKATPYMP